MVHLRPAIIALFAFVWLVPGLARAHPMLDRAVASYEEANFETALLRGTPTCPWKSFWSCSKCERSSTTRSVTGRLCELISYVLARCVRAIS